MQTKSWLVIDAFVAQGGPKVMLDLLTLAPGEKTLRECVLGSLSVLKLVTLHPNGEWPLLRRLERLNWVLTKIIHLDMCS